MTVAMSQKSSTLRALALALCTLWGNILLLDTPGSVLLSAPFASRMASMAFSIVGFAAAWACGRTCAMRPMRSRRALLAASAVLSAVGSLLHFGEFAWLPGWADVCAVAVFSVAFAFLLVACGEVYAQMGARRAVVCASVSYLLAYLGSTLVAGLGAQAICAVETLLPLAIGLAVAQGRDAGEGSVRAGGASGLAGVGARSASGPANASGSAVGGAPASAGAAVRAACDPALLGGAPVLAAPAGLREAIRATLEAIPARVLTAIGITYFAIGSTLAQAGTPLDYFTWETALAAVLTSVAVMGATILLHGRVTLTSLYKVLMVGQVLAAFLLSEWSGAAQVAIVITFVGVKIVAWTLMAELALLAQARGAAPAALVYAAGCLAGHIGEGVAGVVSVFGLVDQGSLTIVVVALLVGAAAFLFTGQTGRYPDISDAFALDDEGAADMGLAGMGGAFGGRNAVLIPAGEGPACSPSRPDPFVRPSAAQGDASPAADASSSTALDARISELASAYLLSARETEVFRLWATGHTLKYIQEKLYLSPSTVKTHVRHIYDKTGLHSRAEIVELLDPLAQGQGGAGETR